MLYDGACIGVFVEIAEHVYFDVILPKTYCSVNTLFEQPHAN
jgi:hypothetical protein